MKSISSILTDQNYNQLHRIEFIISNWTFKRQKKSKLNLENWGLEINYLMALVFFKVKTQVGQIAIKWDSLDHSQWVLYDSVTWRTTITHQWCGNAVVIFIDVASDWHFATSFHLKSLNATSTSHGIKELFFFFLGFKMPSNNSENQPLVSWKCAHISIPLLRTVKNSTDPR